MVLLPVVSRVNMQGGGVITRYNNRNILGYNRYKANVYKSDTKRKIQSANNAKDAKKAKKIIDL